MDNGIILNSKISLFSFMRFIYDKRKIRINNLIYKLTLSIILIFTTLTDFYLKKSYANLINNISEIPSYKLGPGDVIYTNITNVPGFESQVRIIPDGTVNLPRIGEINLLGLSINEANTKITKAYQKIINRPIIYVNLISSRPLKISVFGEVQRPGIYSLTSTETNRLVNSDGGEESIVKSSGWPTLIDAIQKAGGLNQKANLKNITINRKLDNNEYVALKVNYWDGIMYGDITDNPFIYDEDNIIVNQAKDISIKESLKISSSNLTSPSITVNVIGEVRNPGSLKIKTNSPLSQAILAAGGITTRGKKTNIELVRLNSNGSLDINLFKFNSKDNSNDNPPLIDGDIIVVDRTNWSKFNDSFKNIVQPVGPILNAASIYKLLDE